MTKEFFTVRCCHCGYKTRMAQLEIRKATFLECKECLAIGSILPAQLKLAIWQEVEKVAGGD
ncbi:MAG: hypothetical protein JWL93_2615 [Hyphomicrobiales bacterium]|nr:hypothetical protein [Hyphomicrobiales bacterium]